jgi:gamma-glutamylcyclotransferase
MADLRETFLYFAYGSNMLTRRLTARTPSAVAVATAYVEGYRLTFDKVSSDGSGKCDIEPTGNAADLVWAVLFRIATAEAADLDDAEGLGHGYRKGEVQAIAASTKTLATAYFATHKDPARLPYDWYNAFVLQGAIQHELPEDYIEQIRSVVSQPDPDPARRARNEGLLQRKD